jgi:hypothetical protein
MGNDLGVAGLHQGRQVTSQSEGLHGSHESLNKIRNQDQLKVKRAPPQGDVPPPSCQAKHVEKIAISRTKDGGWTQDHDPARKIPGQKNFFSPTLTAPIETDRPG